MYISPLRQLTNKIGAFFSFGELKISCRNLYLKRRGELISTGEITLSTTLKYTSFRGF